MRAEMPALQLKFACCREFRLCGGDKGAMETDEVCGRPLDPFAAYTPILDLYRKFVPEHPIRTAGSLDKHADTA